MAKSKSGGGRDFEAALWAAADKLRGTLETVEYKGSKGDTALSETERAVSPFRLP